MLLLSVGIRRRCGPKYSPKWRLGL